jgi:hypothetical protein
VGLSPTNRNLTHTEKVPALVNDATRMEPDIIKLITITHHV